MVHGIKNPNSPLFDEIVRHAKHMLPTPTKQI